MYFHHDSVGEIKKYCCGNQKASYSQTTNSPAFVCGNAKREREEERKGKKARWGHEEEEECIHMRRWQAAHAGLYS